MFGEQWLRVSCKLKKNVHEANFFFLIKAEKIDKKFTTKIKKRIIKKPHRFLFLTKTEEIGNKFTTKIKKRFIKKILIEPGRRCRAMHIIAFNK